MSDMTVVLPNRLRRVDLSDCPHERVGLDAEARRCAKATWRPLLQYVAALHHHGTHGPLAPLTRCWEEIGPGYLGGPCFGHWDIVHAAADALHADPAFVRAQIENQIERQSEAGSIPGVLTWNAQRQPFYLNDLAPSVWPFLLDDWIVQHGADAGLLRKGLAALRRLLAFMERERSCEQGGWFYVDARDRKWESGIDEGVRFDEDLIGAERVFACVDATAHVAGQYELAGRWAERLGDDSADALARAENIRAFLRDACFDPTLHWFCDAPMVDRPERRVLSFEGMWALVVGAADDEQAQRAIDRTLLSADGLLGAHGMMTVGRREPRFEPRMWRGPCWNSMTWWAARGCLRYGRADAAAILIERALDGAAEVFEQTGTIWEFYGPDGESPETIQRKPGSPLNQPCRDYLGHNPLLAMARLRASLRA